MAELRLDSDSHLQYGPFGSDLADICIDPDGEWDINLFEELENLSDAEELLQEFEFSPHNKTTWKEVNDINLLQWRSFASGDTDACCTGVGVPGSSLSPGSALSDTSSLSPLSLKEDAVSMQPLPTMLTPQRVSIQPKPPPSVPLTHPVAPFLKTRTIVIQPVGLQTVVSVVKAPSPVTVHATAPSTAGHTMHLKPRQLIGPQIASPAPALLTVTNQVVTMPTVPHHVTMGTTVLSGPAHPMTVTYHNTAVDTEVCAVRRQQRMLKNRESATLSRLRRKEAQQALEARLKGALCENQRLLRENGSLRTQLEGLLTENTVLKVTAPKRRAVCLMVVLVFFVLNTGPISVWESEPSNFSLSTGKPQSSRHLLSFSPDQQLRSGEETPAPQSPLEPLDAQYPQSHQSQDSRWEDYTPEEMALAVVKKEPLLFGSPSSPPCQSHSPVSRSKSLRLAQNLRGWVHRHEEERTKSTRSTTDQSRHTTTDQHTTKTVLKSPEERPQTNQSSNSVVTVRYSDRPGREVQVYYSRHQSYRDFFDELNRRGDTFYVVSFRRDHLLLPATNHSKGSRPKMSLVLPAINVNDSVIKDNTFEVMMQIDCEVMDTKILHIKTSTIPEFLRANTTDFQSTHANGKAAASVGVLSDSA
ncbi:cyclic AMP-dependent transcription factor ATF-6 alpha isoform X4 [Coregonus clupeaformis]|uniref:cyclic AMP-dependent transcription factor ATF-6 alpha isoform X4 n=1 Tax=Coregonus clupeaformis TaxID=59861 RepID=UPI001E1C972F|nr:cyclic AMP-dependent transcription factor ATF-6 alpha isoform X4 [Coregonus clupeaformis]